MIIFDKKLGGKIQKAYPCGLSSIIVNIPLVGINAPRKRPYIHKFIPLVSIPRILGFTLVELMVTVAVFGILVAIALPNMRSIIQNTRISTQINELTSDLNFARSEAIKRGTDVTVSNVTVCRSANPTAATPTCDTTAGVGWNSGRIIFIDGTPAVGATAAIAPNGQHAAAETLLRIREVLDGTNTLTANDTSGAGGTNPNAQNLIVYTRAGGTTISSNPPVVPAVFNLCDERGATYGRSLTIGPTGRATVRKSPGGC